MGWGGEGSCPLTPSRIADAIIDCSFVENTFILIGRKIVGARAPPSPPLSVPLHRIDASIPGRVQSLVSWTIKYQDNGNSPTAIVFLYCGLRQIGRYLLPIPNLRKTFGSLLKLQPCHG